MSLVIYESPSRPLELVNRLLDSEYSKKSYTNAIVQFVEWVQGKYFETPTEAVASYRDYLRNERDLTVSTVNLHMSAIRSFFSAAADLNLIDNATLSAVRRIGNIRQVREKIGIWLTLEESKQLLESPNTTTIIGKRDKAILAVFLGTALRISEVAELTWGNINKLPTNKWAFTNIERKHHRVQSVLVPEEVVQFILDYSQPGEPEDRVFVSINRHGQKGTEITTRGIFKLVKKYGTMIGQPELKPHDLRKTWTFLAEQGDATLAEIQQQLGHERSETTDRYRREFDLLENKAVYKTKLF